MLDGNVPENAETVWGFSVPTLGGRRQWPEKLRAMAVERIATGEGIREIAEEIGANKSLVANWVKNAKRRNAAPAFIEVVPPAVMNPGKGQVPNAPMGDPAASCRIRIGDADITIPPGYPAAHLAEILSAVRSSQ